MPKYNIKRFSEVKVLKSVSPQVLLEFLTPHAGFIALKGLELPQSNGKISDFDYLKLASILMNTDQQMPDSLIDALFFTHEMGTDRTMDEMLGLAKRLNINIPSESTPMDIAMRIWVRDSQELEKAHSAQRIYRSRTFQYYKADGPMPFHNPNDDSRIKMETVLDAWFEEHKYGGNTRVFIYPSEDEIYFLVRHGDTFKRESAVEGYDSKGIIFRPEAFDVVCYVPSLGELRINAKKKGEHDLYRREFGRLIAANPLLFPGLDKYNLSPIIDDGERCLVTRDIEGIDGIMLTEIQVIKNKIHYKLLTTYTAPNVFLAFNDDNIKLHSNVKIIKAKFNVKFTNEDKPRIVTITPPNKLSLCREADSSLVEEWLFKRGFIKND